MNNIKELKKELGLKDKDLAQFFGLAPKDYYKSSARKRYEESFIKIYDFLKEKRMYSIAVKISKTDEFEEAVK